MAYNIRNNVRLVRCFHPDCCSKLREKCFSWVNFPKPPVACLHTHTCAVWSVFAYTLRCTLGVYVRTLHGISIACCVWRLANMCMYIYYMSMFVVIFIVLVFFWFCVHYVHIMRAPMFAEYNIYFILILMVPSVHFLNFSFKTTENHIFCAYFI